MYPVFSILIYLILRYRTRRAGCNYIFIMNKFSFFRIYVTFNLDCCNYTFSFIFISTDNIVIDIDTISSNHLNRIISECYCICIDLYCSSVSNVACLDNILLDSSYSNKFKNALKITKIENLGFYTKDEFLRDLHQLSIDECDMDSTKIIEVMNKIIGLRVKVD